MSKFTLYLQAHALFFIYKILLAFYTYIRPSAAVPYLTENAKVIGSIPTQGNDLLSFHTSVTRYSAASSFAFQMQRLDDSAEIGKRSVLTVFFSRHILYIVEGT